MEEKLFEKFVCWAKTVISSKTATNKAAQSLMETLEAYIADIDAIRVEFTTERVDLEKDLEEVNFAIEEAAALRKRENEDFLVAAFAQFGSDLDASTQHQLLRGGILTELLKQKQFVPMMTQEIIVSLWAGTRGYLDKVATKEILRFEALWLDHMRSTKADILTKIMVEKAISDEIENGIKAGMDEFLSLNEFEGRTV